MPATVAKAKAKAKVSFEKYLASLVQREEEGWSVLAEEVKPAPEEHFCSSAGHPGQAQGGRQPSHVGAVARETRL